MGRFAPFFLLWFLPTLAAAAPEGYYRFPAIHGDTVVFSAEGDLWQVDADGGVARRLTTHPAEETHPAISPDGRTLAFSAAYEGPTEVYTMPLEGGLPRRHTWHGERGRRVPRVVGFTPAGEVLYATRAYSTLPNTQLVRLDPATGDPALVPLSQAADGVYVGATLFFTRQDFQGSHAKRYRGGTAQQLWKLEEGAAEAVPLTADYPGTSKRPLAWQGRVYFASDRDGTMNLWSMDEDGGDLRQHTFHQGWDVKSPSLEGGRVVYQLGADLRLYDVASGKDRELDVTLASDFDQTRERWIDEPMDYLTAAHLAPGGDRVVLTARGEVFVAPVEQGRFVHVTRSPGVRYRQGRFFPDGKGLLALSDESGEVEWWRLPADGVGARKELTTDGKVLRYDGVPSPDGRFIAHHDHDSELWLTDLGTGVSKRLAVSPSWPFEGLPAFSPDSRWLAWSVYGANQLARIVLYEIASGTETELTSDRYHSFDPAWSPDGEWLYFLSNRHFRSLVRSPWGERAPDPFFDRSTGVYAVALKPGARFPFAPVDEFHPPKKDRGSKDEDGEKDMPPPKVEVTLAGLAERLYEVPVEPGNLGDLAVAGGRLYWLDRETSFEGRRHLRSLEIGPQEPKVETVVEDVRAFELAGGKLMVRKDDAIYVVDAPREGRAAIDAEALAKAEVDLSRWRFPLDPREEWRQMFVDAWRLHRDYFYDRSMHGVDWPAMREKYAPLAERVTSRGELSDLLGQLISELSALHASVRGGDFRTAPDDVDPAFLGAVLERDAAAGGYRVARIYRGDPELPGEAAPLLRPGVEVRKGDVVVAVNGVATLDTPPGALLRDQAGRQVRLKVAPAEGGEAREVIVEPVDARRAADLRYDDWETSRRLRVEEAGEGRVGYVHLRAMGSGNVAEWQREHYPVFDRPGLIVDVRHNSGGNIDSWVLGKLLRRAWMYWQGRTGVPYWNMQQAFRGHLVVLVDEWTASDGEAFAEGFRRLGLGPVIGTRTWGGEIWLSSANVLVDRGIATAAETGVYGPEGEWLIEGHGVDPDVVVDNLPRATFDGGDAQLEAAIDYLEGKIREDPRQVPPAPPYPDKSEH